MKTLTSVYVTTKTYLPTVKNNGNELCLLNDRISGMHNNMCYSKTNLIYVYIFNEIVKRKQS